MFYIEKLLPSWPNDFSWNTNGIPEACTCKKDECDCRCVNIAEPADSHGWRDNYLCFAKTKYLPDIKWSHRGKKMPFQCCNHHHFNNMSKSLNYSRAEKGKFLWMLRNGDNMTMTYSRHVLNQRGILDTVLLP